MAARFGFKPHSRTSVRSFGFQPNHIRPAESGPESNESALPDKPPPRGLGNCRARRRILDDCGQATVEAAFLLPVFLLVLGLMLQPAVLLYNRCVMQGAAAEACRLLETSTVNEAVAKAYVERRLAAVPNADAFHCGGEHGWKIELTDGGGTGKVKVKITNYAKPLPLLGVVAGLAASREKDGRLKQQVSASARLWPKWAQDAGKDPGELVSAWE